MRTLVATITVFSALVVMAPDAHALVFANKATLDSSYYADVQDLSKSAGGTSEADDNRASFKQKDGTVTLIFVTYDFPKTTISSGTRKVYFVVDADVKGTVSGRVTKVNGTSVVGTPTTTISGTKNANKLFALEYTLSAATDITSITFLIVLADADMGAQLLIDAVALPEPGTWLLFGLGAAGLGAWNVRRRKRRPA
ncbi:MAG: PEP-CTERM sorting domain-containing protein [Planctomycetota bacterium]